MSGPPRRVTRRAHAKINVFLRVRGRRDDGYHDIESLILPISLYDDVTLGLAGSGPNAVSLDGAPDLVRTLSRIDPAANLALRALHAASDAWTPAGGSPLDASITLTKRIPVAAGLGGGSADAAATLWAANDLWSIGADPLEVASLGASIGSDVPALTERRPVLARGRGEWIEAAPACPTRWVIVPLGFPVSARDAYRWWDEDPVTGPDGTEVVDAFGRRDVAALGRCLFNDLQPAVLARYPQVGRTIDSLMAAGALGAIMSGSGPSVAALVDDPGRAEAVAQVVPGSIAVQGLVGPTSP